MVPAYDMLGLPGPAWIFRLLMALTLALHWAFVGIVIGGTAMVLINGLASRKQPGLAAVNSTVVSFFPFALSMGMTLGIAPLLFVQVLYGHLFYSANILLGFVWLAIVDLVIAVFYLLWLMWKRLKSGKPSGVLLPGSILVLAALVALILSSNATLTQTPSAWAALWAKGGNRLYLGDRTLVPRLLFAFAGLTAIGGMFTAITSRSPLVTDEDARAQGASTGLCVAAAALAAQILFGIVAMAMLPGAVRSAVFGSGGVFGCVAGTLFIVSLPLVLLARKSPTKLKLALPALAYFVGLFALAGARDLARRAAAAPHADLANVTVRPQWDSMAVFLVLFIGGLGVVGWLVKLSLDRAEPEPA